MGKPVTRFFYINGDKFKDGQDRLFVVRDEDSVQGATYKTNVAAHANEHMKDDLIKPVTHYAVSYTHIFDGHASFTRIGP